MNTKLDKKMVYFFGILIWIFALGSSYYLVRNNFASETIEIVFPAIGAILFSAFLGYKAIALDLPKISSQQTPVALLVDWNSGAMTSMVRRRLEDRIEKMDRFSGLHDLNDFLLFDKFGQLNLSGRLTAQSTNELAPVTETELDILEYSLFSWLSKLEQFYAFQPSPLIYGISGHGGGGYVTGISLEQIPQIPIESESGPENILQTTIPISLKLPVGSRAVRNATNAMRTLKIITPHSTMLFRLTIRHGGVFQPEIDVVSRKITQVMGITNADHRWINVFLMEISAEQNSFSRFSDQSKLENKWIDHIKQSYDEDFSWSRLRDAYGQ